LAGIVDSAMDAVISVDERQRICLFNPAAEQVFGLSAAEALGQPLTQLIPEGFRTAQGNEQTGIRAPHMGALREITGLRANGEEFPIEASISQSCVARGRLLTAILRDITERKRGEDALRQTQQLLHLFVEHAPAAIAMLDRHMCYLAASARWRADYHLGPEIIGRSHYEVLPEIPERWKEVHRRALAGEVLRAEDDCFERADGTVQWLLWEARPWVTTTGEVGGILIFTEDITDIKRTEQALRESEERFQLASEIGRFGTWDWNVRTGEVIWSRGHYEILDYFVGEIAPSYAAWAERVHAEDRPMVEEEIRRSMANHADYATEFRVVWPDGSIRWMSTRARYEYGDDGVCRRMVGIMADVTELKEAERQLQDMNSRLTALLAERTRLADERAVHLRALAVELTHAEQRERDRLYELLHDHVQPLLVGARLSLSGLDQRTSTDTWVWIAAEARKHITEALDTARSLGTELNPPVVREQGLGPALEWLCHWARTRQRLEVDLECDVTAEPADTATRMLLFKATRELLMNVAKHAGVNQVTLAMECIAGPAVQITVSDRGIGFDPAARGEAWGPQNASGLWNIERRLGMIGGRIDVDSAPGAGTTVRLSAPLGASTHRSNPPQGHDARFGGG
jgi:PAS domain S-box-containing protein